MPLDSCHMGQSRQTGNAMAWTSQGSVQRRRGSSWWSLKIVTALTIALVLHPAIAFNPTRPVYRYGDPITVECMNRSSICPTINHYLNLNSETGEHIQNDSEEIQWLPFPRCAETSAPLQFQYGVETELDCTIALVDDPFFHLLEFYIHADAPLACRLPAYPAAQVIDRGHSTAAANLRRRSLPEVEKEQEGGEVKTVHPVAAGIVSTDGRTNERPVAPAAVAPAIVAPTSVSVAKTKDQDEVMHYIPLVFALAGTLQKSHLHVCTKLNVLLHSSELSRDALTAGPSSSSSSSSTKRGSSGSNRGGGQSNSDSSARSWIPWAWGGVSSRRRSSTVNMPPTPPVKGSKWGTAADAGVLDSGIAYSTSPLAATGPDTVRLVIGDSLPLRLSVRWFPTPALPHTEGRVRWNGEGGAARVYATTALTYAVLAFGAGFLVSAAYFFGSVLPRRLRGRSLGGATPLGYGIMSAGVGNGWGLAKGHKRMD